MNEEWRENFYLLSKDINEEKLAKRVILLRFKMFEEETKQLVCDHYLEDFFPAELDAFVRIGVEYAYTQDFSERTTIG
jgi:hypothetical protein